MTLRELYVNVRFRLEGRVVHLHPKGKTKGYVLISYFTYPFLTDKPLTGHTNYWEVRQMAKEFLDRGYAVDVIDSSNSSFKPKKAYSVCIDTHGNLERFAPLLQKECIKVFHTTTSHWLFQNTASYKRSYDLLKRRGAALGPERLLPPSTTIEAADIVLLLGNDATESTYSYANKEIFRISISAVFSFPSPQTKDFASVRNNFVWLGGAGAIHKGADLVLEAFAQEPKLSVSMCGKYLYPEFEAVYRKELHDTANIQSIGFVDLNGKVFEDIRSSSAFLIYPSCSEGQAGSVVAAMHAGLIPIISKHCGVDVGDFGFVLKENTIEEIREIINQVAALPEAELKRRSHDAWAYAQKHHTKEQFTMRFSHFVDLLEKRV